MHYRPDEIEYLQKNFNGFNTEEMAAALGRTVSSIENKVQRLGLASRREERPFSEADDRYILEHYAKGNAAELSRVLHHSAREINGRAARLLRKLAPDTREGMRRMHHKYGKAACEIARRYHISPYLTERVLAGRDTLYDSVRRKPKARKTYRLSVTDTVCMQLCIGDFEGLSIHKLARLYSLNPLCVPRMLQSMHDSGAYDRYIGEFRYYNPICYERARQRREKN